MISGYVVMLGVVGFIVFSAFSNDDDEFVGVDKLGNNELDADAGADADADAKAAGASGSELPATSDLGSPISSLGSPPVDHRSPSTPSKFARAPPLSPARGTLRRSSMRSMLVDATGIAMGRTASQRVVRRDGSARRGGSEEPAETI